MEATGRLVDAEPLFRRYSNRRAELRAGPSRRRPRPHQAGGIASSTNRLAEAEPLYRRALAIDERSLGRDHPVVARDLNNLAQLLRFTDRLAEAESLSRRAFKR